ncbi:hypothetical protein KKE54_05650 [bacterium]|nr:hypothetical protein [bacterium]
MPLSYQKISYFLLPVMTLFLLTACSAIGEDGAVSESNSSSETGDGFIVLDDVYHTHAASIVIGQKNFSGSDSQETAANNVRTPYGNPTVVDGMLYLPDFGNNRVLGYNAVPANSGEWADFVVGQRNLTNSFSGSDEYQNNGIKTVTVAKGKLLVTDRGNSRILIYNRRPLFEPAKADVVVGQIDFGRSSPGLADNRLNLPESLYVADDRLIVADSKNNRVLIWNTIPTASGAAADIVLGQMNFYNNTVIDPPSAKSLNFPTAVWSNGTQLIVLDAGNNRILIWSTFPTADNQAADIVLGQLYFTQNEANQGGEPSESTLSFSADGGGLCSNGSQLFVSDSGNNRILIWNTIPTANDEKASGLIGQDDYTLFGANRSTGIVTDKALSNPTGVYQFYNKLLVTDTGNNRYLIFESK